MAIQIDPALLGQVTQLEHGRRQTDQEAKQLLTFRLPFQAEVFLERHLSRHEGEERGAHAKRCGRDRGDSLLGAGREYHAASLDGEEVEAVDIEIDAIEEGIEVVAVDPFGEGAQIEFRVDVRCQFRQHLRLRAPEVTVKVMDVAVKPNLSIGYVMGVGDEVPPALEQLGARIEFLDDDDLAWGDLMRFDVIMTGVRAYERRADLRANNQRLIEYARAGGTVIVNYNKFEFNEAQYGPYPAKVSSGRITDEQAPVQILVPDHPVFQVPNRITDAAWKGWVQERGLYFLGDRDQRYVDLVQLEDPFDNNRGPKRGALVEARVGRGRWIYVGLGLVWALPLRFVFLGIGRGDPDAPPEDPPGG